MMSRFVLSSLSLLLAAVPAVAQIGSSPLPAPPALLEPMSLSEATVQDLLVPATAGEAFEVRVGLGGAQHTVRFRPYDIRTPDFRLLVDDGETIRRVPTPPSVTYRGEVVGEPDAMVAGSVVNGQLEAVIGLDGVTWGIEPASRSMAALPPTSHLVYRNADVTQHGTCGLDTSGTATPEGGPQMAGATLKEAEIGIDASRNFYLLHGSSTTNAQNAITSIMNGVDQIYVRDVQVTFRISTIIVRTSPTYSNSASTALNQFRSRWNNQHSGVQRDLAHLFHGRPGSGVLGIAFLGVVCNRFNAYGVSWYLNSFTARVGVAAHEIGHNFNAPHCDGARPCNIMCSGLGGCSRNLTQFAPVSINRIAPYALSRGCLSNASSNPPTISSISPTSVGSHNPPTITITGTELGGISKITVGTTDITNFTTSGSTQVTFKTPDPFEIATHPVTATNGAGTSNSVNLTVTGTHPSEFDAPALHPRGIGLDYKMYTDRNWTAAVFLSTSNQPSALPGIVSMGIGNNFANIVHFANVPADIRGFAQLNITVSTGTPPVTLHWQLVTFDPSNLTLPVEVSNVETVSIF